MSTRSYINKQVKVGAIAAIPLMPWETCKRELYVSAEIGDLLRGPKEDSKGRSGKLLAEMQGFVKGNHVTMCFIPYQHKEAQFGLLDSLGFVAWDFRSRDPRPGLRVFGAFPKKDVFVGLRWRPRSREFLGILPLGNADSGEWEAEIRKTSKLWKRLFRNLSPVVGKTASDLVSENAIDYT